MTLRRDVPSYAELLARQDAPPGSAWGVFGEGDEVGTLNFLTPQHRREAARRVVTGETFPLDIPLDAFSEPLITHRGALVHTVFGLNEYHRDDRIDNFFPQATSQIDGLRHFGHPDYGFYNDADPSRLVAGTPTLGVQRFSEHGIVGRGLLLDVARFLADAGDPIDYREPRAVPVRILDETARHQDVHVEPGDILLIRFGWLGHRLKYGEPRSSAQERNDPVGGRLLSVGLSQSHDTAAWLWDHQVALAAADNVALEAWPASGSHLEVEAETSGALAPSAHSGMLHRILIPLLGLAIGELWQLDDLALACAADERYDFMVAASPLRLPGGVGSPANAVAIR